VLAPYLDGNLDHVWTPEQLVGISSEHAPNFAPGDGTEYSNTDYTLLGMIVELATSHSVADEVQRRILEPLGLEDTSVPSTPELTAPYAHGYFVDLDMADVTATHPSLSSHGGNLVSTADDLATFFDALFGGELLSPDALAEMQVTTTSAGGEVLGLGLQVFTMPCGTFIGHSGSTPGYKAAVFNDLEHDRQFVILANSLTLDDQVGNEAANAAFDAAATAFACP
jgi:D-alanyl-D-alanine carboxypeptidase